MAYVTDWKNLNKKNIQGTKFLISIIFYDFFAISEQNLSNQASIDNIKDIIDNRLTSNWFNIKNKNYFTLCL